MYKPTLFTKKNEDASIIRFPQLNLSLLGYNGFIHSFIYNLSTLSTSHQHIPIVHLTKWRIKKGSRYPQWIREQNDSLL